MNTEVRRSRFALRRVLFLALAPFLSAAETPPAQRYDLVVYGGTPAGIACAVRAAREGLTVQLVSPFPNLGGALSNGLTTMDTLLNGQRAPLYDELRASIYQFYREKYGADSEQYRRSLPGQPKTKVEAHVFEQLITAMAERERNITVLRGYYPQAATRTGAVLQDVTFVSMKGDAPVRSTGYAFADCSYEGDLLAAAAVDFRIGREARDEFNEEHAGRIFMTEAKWPPSAHVDPAYIADYRRLNLVHYDRWYDIIRPASTGEADPTVQAYNLRTVLTRDPANRVPFERPPGYDRDALVARLGRDINWPLTLVPTVNQPNEKTYINLPEIVGLQRDYPAGDWATRRRITEEHAFITRSLLYFMQHDEAVTPEIRRQWSEWGLPRDEFADNDHLPREIYVREARRVEGRARFTEHDARMAPGLRRAPVHADAIGITEWFLDSHACTPHHVPGSMFEGELLLNHITFPGQIPFRTILPRGLDNLLVPVCASSSHIGWGALRLEPTWMGLAEAAAYAVILGMREKLWPAQVEPDQLVRLLAEKGFVLSFFNDVEVDGREPWVGAVQYLGTQGFFGSYEADPLDALDEPLGDAWAEAAAELVTGARVDVMDRARRMLAVEQEAGFPLTVGAFVQKLASRLRARGVELRHQDLMDAVPLAGDIRLSRGNACRLIVAASRQWQGAQKARATWQPFDEPRQGLAQVLILGDSIAAGYTPQVRERLRHRADVYRPDENCRDTGYGLSRIEHWLGARRWDVIHFNFGLHDLKHTDASGGLVSPATGKRVNTVAQYEANLRQLAERLQRTGARLVFATTTPVPEGAHGRIPQDERAYNDAARRVMKDFGIPVTDLHGVAAAQPGRLQQPANVHFLPEGNAALAGAVLASIKPRLTTMFRVPGLPEDVDAIDWARIPSLRGQTAAVARGVPGESGHMHHPSIVHFDGRYFAAWNDSFNLEDRPGQRVRFATSRDGLKWSEPAELTGRHPRRRYTNCGFWVRDGELYALAALRDARDIERTGEEAVLFAFPWDRAAGKFGERRVMARDFFAQNVPQRAPDGAWLMLGKSGNEAWGIMKAARGGVRGIDEWTVTPINDVVGQIEEPEWYALDDGRVAAHFRTRPAKRLMRSFSSDSGVTWTSPALTDFPEAGARHHGLRLKNGVYALVVNPNTSGRRVPLSIALSRDGLTYDRIANIRGDLPTPRTNDNPGFNYMRALEHEGRLLTIYSLNQEDIALTIVAMAEIDALDRSGR
jgi:lysophospholipase L1-like esterase